MPSTPRFHSKVTHDDVAQTNEQWYRTYPKMDPNSPTGRTWQNHGTIRASTRRLRHLLCPFRSALSLPSPAHLQLQPKVAISDSCLRPVHGEKLMYWHISLPKCGKLQGEWALPTSMAGLPLGESGNSAWLCACFGEAKRILTLYPTFWTNPYQLMSACCSVHDSRRKDEMPGDLHIELTHLEPPQIAIGTCSPQI